MLINKKKLDIYYKFLIVLLMNINFMESQNFSSNFCQLNIYHDKPQNLIHKQVNYNGGLLNPKHICTRKTQSYLNSSQHFLEKSNNNCTRKTFRSQKLKQMCSKHKNKYFLNPIHHNQLVKKQNRKTEGYDANSFDIRNKSQIIKFSRKNTEAQVDQVERKIQYNQKIPIEIQLNFQKIFTTIAELQRLEFSQKSISQWMNKFLNKKNIAITQIFMKMHSNQKSLSNSMVYERQTDIKISHKKLLQSLKRFPLQKSQYIANQIKQLKICMQQVLIKKSLARIKEIENSFRCKMNAKMMIAPIMTSPQLLHFMNDLKVMQSKNGALQMLSNVNRVKFQAINKAEQLFQTVYYDQKALLNSKKKLQNYIK